MPRSCINFFHSDTLRQYIEFKFSSSEDLENVRESLKTEGLMNSRIIVLEEAEEFRLICVYGN